MKYFIAKQCFWFYKLFQTICVQSFSAKSLTKKDDTIAEKSPTSIISSFVLVHCYFGWIEKVLCVESTKWNCHSLSKIRFEWNNLSHKINQTISNKKLTFVQQSGEQMEKKQMMWLLNFRFHDATKLIKHLRCFKHAYCTLLT